MITITAARAFNTVAEAVHEFDHVRRVAALAERIGWAEGAIGQV